MKYYPIVVFVALVSCQAVAGLGPTCSGTGYPSVWGGSFDIQANGSLYPSDVFFQKPSAASGCNIVQDTSVTPVLPVAGTTYTVAFYDRGTSPCSCGDLSFTGTAYRSDGTGATNDYDCMICEFAVSFVFAEVLCRKSP
jgi:hypothetical protein